MKQAILHKSLELTEPIPLSFSICSFLKASTFFSTSFYVAFDFSLSKAFTHGPYQDEEVSEMKK
jgi:hypothetical protein